jgi:WD40 repeat protein
MCTGMTTPLPRSSTKYLSWEADNGSLQIHSQTTNTLLGGEVNRVMDIYERLHKGKINVVKVTGNGKYVLTGGSDALVVVWSLQRTTKDHFTLDIFKSLCGHDDAVTCMDTSSSYATVVTGSADRSVIVWDLGKYQLVHTLRGGHGSAVRAVSINQSTGNFCSMCSDTLAYWHVNGSLLARANLEVDILGLATTVLATNCPEYQYGITFVTGHASGMIGLWDVM